MLALDRNRAVILLFEFLWGLAMPFVYYSTVLPGYLRHLGLAGVWIGLAPALHSGALALVQPLSAYAIQPGARRLARMRAAYALGACAYAVLGLQVLWGTPPVDAGGLSVAGLVTLAAVLAFAVAVGTGDPHYMALVVGAVPAEQRGRYFGMRMVCLGLGGIAGGTLAEQTLRLAPAPANFGWCFLLGGLLYVASTLCMAFYRDAPEKEEPDPPPSSFRSFLAERMLPQMREGAFPSYLLAVVFFSLGSCGFPFLAL
jgi:hypothetical protein